jgi:ketosteroid isomerase-like protein
MVARAFSPRRWARGRRDERDIEVAAAMFTAFAAEDAERMLALADEGILVEGGPIAERTGRTDPYRGHQGLKELLRDLAKIWGELQVSPREYRHLGGAVLVTATMTAHSQGGMMSGSVAWIYRIRRGKIVSIEVFRSESEALASANRAAVGPRA